MRVRERTFFIADDCNDVQRQKSDIKKVVIISEKTEEKRN